MMNLDTLFEKFSRLMENMSDEEFNTALEQAVYNSRDSYIFDDECEDEYCDDCLIYQESFEAHNQLSGTFHLNNIALTNTDTLYYPNDEGGKAA